MITKFENILLRIREDIVARISQKLRKIRYSELLYQEIFKNGIRDAGNSTHFDFFFIFSKQNDSNELHSSTILFSILLFISFEKMLVVSAYTFRFSPYKNEFLRIFCAFWIFRGTREASFCTNVLSFCTNV